ncbi:hypothetical protein VN97_g544 [Penicillium thymicola]|uniref:Uncharacterized protein n=1 Tax=Penicillium thymicola TaxID=293382 RepID=A0AAI9TTE9_PENTH|nr:hypothetical protein VN97_g544 [Penicillium thymicola]
MQLFPSFYSHHHFHHFHYFYHHHLPEAIQYNSTHHAVSRVSPSSPKQMRVRVVHDILYGGNSFILLHVGYFA